MSTAAVDSPAIYIPPEHPPLSEDEKRSVENRIRRGQLIDRMQAQVLHAQVEKWVSLQPTELTFCESKHFIYVVITVNILAIALIIVAGILITKCM